MGAGRWESACGCRAWRPASGWLIDDVLIFLCSELGGACVVDADAGAHDDKEEGEKGEGVGHTLAPSALYVLAAWPDPSVPSSSYTAPKRLLRGHSSRLVCMHKNPQSIRVDVRPFARFVIAGSPKKESTSLRVRTY